MLSVTCWMWTQIFKLTFSFVPIWTTMQNECKMGKASPLTYTALWEGGGHLKEEKIMGNRHLCDQQGKLKIRHFCLRSILRKIKLILLRHEKNNQMPCYKCLSAVQRLQTIQKNFAKLSQSNEKHEENRVLPTFRYLFSQARARWRWWFFGILHWCGKVDLPCCCRTVGFLCCVAAPQSLLKKPQNQ